MLAEFNWMQAAGSPVMIALMLCSVVAFGIAAERAWFYSKFRGNAGAIARDAIRLIRLNNMTEAAHVCRNAAHPVGPVSATLFENKNEDVTSIEERLHVALSQQKLLLERNLNVLGTLAAVAPLLGLLGTVWGIMRAFHDMAQVGSAAPSVVAAGVAEALVTTAAGLVVAVPALILYNHFARRMNVMLTIAENETRLVRTELHNASKRASGSGDKHAPRREQASQDAQHASAPA
jgi:biopolymer transport protein ExbB